MLNVGTNIVIHVYTGYTIPKYKCSKVTKPNKNKNINFIFVAVNIKEVFLKVIIKILSMIYAYFVEYQLISGHKG